jgi:hypothetical protein
VLLDSGAPAQLDSPAEPEHGRTIPLGDIRASQLLRRKQTNTPRSAARISLL